MADNVTLNLGSGGDTIAADDVGGAKYQRVKLSLGADGTVGDAPVGGGVESGVLRVTLASDSTGVLSVDDNGGSLTVDGTVTANATLAAETTKVIGTVNIAAAQTLATVTTVGAVTSLTNALPAGDNNIGNVDIVSLPTLAAVTTVSTVTNVATIGTSVTPGTSAAHLGKAADAVAGATDTGVAILAIRDDALTTLTPADGDYAPLRVSSTGALHVTGGGGGTQYAEDAAHASGDTGTMALVVRRDADTTLAGTDGDYAPLQVNAAGSLKVAITAGAGSGGTSIADGATFTRDTTSVTLAAAAVETSAPTLNSGDAAALSMTTGGALRVSIAGGGIAGIVDDAAFTPATSEVLPIGFTFDNSSPDSVDEGDIGAARMSANRNIFVNIRDNAGNERGLNVDASGFIGVTDGGGTLTVDATNLSCNVAQINGVTPLMGNGASGTGAHRVTVANDSTGILAGVTTVSTVTTVGTVTNITNQGQIVDDAAFTPATTRVTMAGFFADETATDSVEEGDGGSARMTLDRKQIVASYAHAAGGYTPVSTVSAASTNATSLKASAGTVGAVTVTNVNAAMRYLKFYNKASAPTVGSDTPVYVIPIPGNTAGAGATMSFGPAGLNFSTGIAWALTTGAAVADTGAVSASEHIVSIAYI